MAREPYDLKAQAAKLAKRLEAIPAEIVAELRPALVKGAEDVASAMRALAPEDEGDLKASIAVTGPGQTTPAYASEGDRRTAGPNQALVTVGNPDVRHGHMVEFGTAPHTNGGQFAGTQNPGTEAQPFMQPAVRITRAKVQRRITTAINRAVKKAATEGTSNA